MSFWLVARLEADYEPSDSEGQTALDELHVRLTRCYEEQEGAEPQWDEVELGSWDREEEEETEHFCCLAWLGPMNLARVSDLISACPLEDLGTIKVTELDWSSRKSASLGGLGKQLPAGWLQALQQGRTEQRITALAALLPLGEEGKRWGKIIAADLGAPSPEPAQVVVWYLAKQAKAAQAAGHTGLAIALTEAAQEKHPFAVGRALAFAAARREGRVSALQAAFEEIKQTVIGQLQSSQMQDKLGAVLPVELADLSSEAARECYSSCMLPEDALPADQGSGAYAGCPGMVVVERWPKHDLDRRYMLAHELAHKMTRFSAAEPAGSYFTLEAFTELRAMSWGFSTHMRHSQALAAVAHGLQSQAGLPARDIFYLTDQEIDERLGELLGVGQETWCEQVSQAIDAAIEPRDGPLSKPPAEAVKEICQVLPQSIRNRVLHSSRQFIARLGAGEAFLPG